MNCPQGYTSNPSDNLRQDCIDCSTKECLIPETAIYNSDLGIWYNQLIDDCQSIATECEFTARWSLIEGYHQIGQRILQDNDNFVRAKYGDKIVQCVAKSLNKSERTIYYAVSVARQYPLLDDIPLGKEASWSKVTKLLDGNGGGKEECKHTELEQITRCKECHKIIK